MSHSDVPNLCLKLMQDYTSQELDCFADPFSNQTKCLDGNGQKVSQHMVGSIIWDYYEHRMIPTGESVKGQWYLDFIDNLEDGRELKFTLEDIIDSFENGTPTVVSIDGVRTDLGELSKPELLALRSMYQARRTALALAYRKAIQVYRQFIAINDRFGTKYDDKGKIISVGIVHVDWVYADDLDRSRGLARTNRPIRLHMVYQKNDSMPWISAGSLSGVQQDFSITDFLKLDVNKSAKTWNELINYRKLE